MMLNMYIDDNDDDDDGDDYDDDDSDDDDVERGARQWWWNGDDGVWTSMLHDHPESLKRREKLQLACTLKPLCIFRIPNLISHGNTEIQHKTVCRGGGWCLGRCP